MTTKEFLDKLDLPVGIPKLLTQEEAVRQSIEYIKRRQSGEETLLTTCYNNINNLVGGGFTTNSMLVIAGLSGSGKSTLSKRIIYSIATNQAYEKKRCVSLCFNFEMLAHKTVGREFANKSKTTLTELYSNYEPVADEVLSKLESQISKMSSYQIHYVETPQDYDVIKATILYYWNIFCSKHKDTTFIVEIDHTMITKAKDNDSDKQKIDKLVTNLNEVKKEISEKGGNIFMIVLSQMNRDIKSPDRIKIPQAHRPMTSDLFQSSNVEYYADYIIVAHCPAKLNLAEYTEDKYPVSIQIDVKTGETVDTETGLITDTFKTESRPFIYMHLLKNRDGAGDRMTAMIAELQYFDYIELSGSEFKHYHNQFVTSNHQKCKYDSELKAKLALINNK